MNNTDLPPLPDWVPPCSPRFPWWGGHLQTLATKLQSTDDLAERFAAEEYVLPLDDDSGDSLAATLYSPDEPFELDDEAHGDDDRRPPIVVLLHGLGGTSQSDYIQSSAEFLLTRGHRVLLVDFRGAGDSDSHCDRLHHPGRSQDIAALLDAIDEETKRQLKQAGVVLVGYSLGGSVLLKFLGESSVVARDDTDDGEAGAATSSVGILGAVTVSAPLDLAATSRCLGRITRWPYQRYLLKRMRTQALAEGAEVSESEREAVKAADSVWAFDETFSAPRCGFDNVMDYYTANSATSKLGNIKIPTVLIYALNDPFVPADQYRQIDWIALPMLQSLIVPSGGHASFQVAGDDGSWHDQCIDRYVRRLISG